MVVGTLIRYGIPFSFVYCTIYQQDIWREGDEKLVHEQKKTWRKFFNLIDTGYKRTLVTLNLASESDLNDPKKKLLTKLDSMDFKSCYNSKVACAFATADNFISKPSYVACKVYRTVAPYFKSEPLASPHKGEPKAKEAA